MAGKASDSSWTVSTSGVVHNDSRIVVPNQAALRTRLLELYYDAPTAGHFGVDKTYAALRQFYYWPSMKRDITEYVQCCVVCLSSKAKRHKPYGSLESLPLPSKPMEELSMDFVTGLPEVLHEGKLVDSILVIVDRFTRMTFAFDVHATITAAELAALFHKRIECQFGPPRGLVSDRGSIFTSEF